MKCFFKNTNAALKLEFNTQDMFRVRTSWNRQFQPNEPYMVVQHDWPSVAVKSSDQAEHFLLQTEKLDIKVNKS